MNIIDARGLSCPEPVILTREAIAKNEPNRYISIVIDNTRYCGIKNENFDGIYQVLVDNNTSKENVTRYAEHQGFKVSVSENDGEFTLTLSK